MWKEIKAVWKKEWETAKEAWKCAWEGSKDAICNAIYAVANALWAVVQTVVFMPIKAGLYETGVIVVNHIVNWIKNI